MTTHGGPGRASSTLPTRDEAVALVRGRGMRAWWRALGWYVVAVAVLGAMLGSEPPQDAMDRGYVVTYVLGSLVLVPSLLVRERRQCRQATDRAQTLAPMTFRRPTMETKPTLVDGSGRPWQIPSWIGVPDDGVPVWVTDLHDGRRAVVVLPGGRLRHLAQPAVPLARRDEAPLTAREARSLLRVVGSRSARLQTVAAGTGFLMILLSTPLGELVAPGTPAGDRLGAAATVVAIALATGLLVRGPLRRRAAVRTVDRVTRARVVADGPKDQHVVETDDGARRTLRWRGVPAPVGREVWLGDAASGRGRFVLVPGLDPAVARLQEDR